MPSKIVVRPSEERGCANHGWLDTHHTFSFANYYDPNYEEFGALRVINEDIVQPQKGFGTHSHREFEIFSYIISGELEHKDSMGNLEILKRGDVQFTTAGTGISHSEYNVHKTLPVYFLQIWVKPDNPKLSPAYHTKMFSDSAKENNLVQIISPDKKQVPDTIGIHTDFHMYASLLDQGVKVTHKVQGNANDRDNKRKLYIHVIGKEGMKVLINGKSLLKHGDGAFITEVVSGEEIIFESVGNRTAEFVLFDLA
ncbi:18169_t:CDS:2 [Funneliformis geosporum]|uniref:6763_t:CDS:1 n=1 Tax=Funneliformis geosporum TaxID=1117311 RepID=A0A9W4WVY1_9GLOM|nr:6763_t:CDS:2 [Funneliformis geosporum]CAI2176380.1 18169_t:CDS:2 [Funneliformis geosporum]